MRSDNPAAALPLFDGYFKGAAPNDPEYKVALLEHARALRNVGKYQEAADRFALLLEDDPLEGAYYSGLAEALYRMHLRKEGRFVEEIYKLISQNAFEEHVEDRLRETGNTAFALGQRAANRMRQRRYLDAFRSFLGALEADRGDPRLRVFYADLCLRFSRLRDARAVVNGAIQAGMKPASGLWWMLGRIALEAENAREALAALQNGAQVLQAEGDQGGPDKGQAREPAIARPAVARAAEVQASSWEPLYWLGRIELAAGAAPKALALFEEAQKRGAKSLIDLLHYQALALEAAGRREEAIAQLERVVQSQPGFVDSHKELVRLLASDPARGKPVEDAYAEAQRTREAIRARERQADERPLGECGEIYLELGKLHFKVKDPRAFDDCFLASDLLPGSAEACRLILSGMKQPQDTLVRIHYLRRILELEPDSEEVLAGLAEIFAKLHVRLDEAALLAGKLHALKPTARSYRLRGEVALQRGEREHARGLLQQGLAAFPGDAGLREAMEKVGR
jgi:tetratricopeptide (TPR) repeat protein